MSRARFRPGGGMRQSGVMTFVMATSIIVLATYLIYPIVLLLILSFNENPLFLVGQPIWGFGNWINAWSFPGLTESIWNSFVVWFLESVFSFPLAIVIALLLARTNVPHSRALEFVFWIAFIFPSSAATFGWVMLLSPDWGFINALIALLPGVDEGPFNIYSLKGIVWVKVIGDNLAFKIILLTAAFRNMDGALEQAARVSGSSNLRTMLRVTLPVMIAPIVLAMSLQFVTVFKGFETEFILGSRFNYWVFSSLIYRLVRLEVPAEYGNAVVLASLTLLIIAIIIPFQRWITGRRQYTTIDSAFMPSLIDLGRWRRPAFAFILGLGMLQTAVPALVLLGGSFMTRVGFFNATPVFTLEHWGDVFSRPEFQQALKTTLILAITAGLLSPMVFSLFAYIIVRTRMRGRFLLDSIIWSAAVMPGTLVGLGLLLMFIKTPVLNKLFGTIWVLLIVVVISGITVGTNIFKGVLLQVGASLEEAGRVSGAGWVRTYFRIVVPVLMPTMVLVGMISFVSAAGVTSSIILLASQDTQTLSLLALHYGASRGGQLEEAGIISLVILFLTIAVALPFRTLALRLGVRHDIKASPHIAGARGDGRPQGEPRDPTIDGQRRPADDLLEGVSA